MEKLIIEQCKVYAPYDGCHWERAFRLIHDTGEKVLLYNKDFIEKNKDYFKRSFREALEKDRYTYDLNTEAGRKEFISENNIMSLVNIAKQIQDTIELTDKCPMCGQVSFIGEWVSTGYHGDGGIGIIQTDYVCTECYALHTCNKCGEYSKLYYNEKTDEDLCVYCMPKCPCDNEYNENFKEGYCEECWDKPEFIQTRKNYEQALKLYKDELKYQMYLFPDYTPPEPKLVLP